MAVKRAIIGLRGIAFSKVNQDDITGYKSEAAIALPWVGQLSKTPQSNTQKINYDDQLYATLKTNNGVDFELRLAEMDMETLELLGAGVYDAETGTFKHARDPQYGVWSIRGITDTVSGLPFYFNYRAADLTDVRYDNFATKGDNATVCEVIITGTFRLPVYAAAEDLIRMQLLEDKSNQAACDALITAAETLPEA